MEFNPFPQTPSEQMAEDVAIGAAAIQDALDHLTPWDEIDETSFVGNIVPLRHQPSRAGVRMAIDQVRRELAAELDEACSAIELAGEGELTADMLHRADCAEQELLYFDQVRRPSGRCVTRRPPPPVIA